MEHQVPKGLLSSISGQYLVVILLPRLTLALLERCPPASFRFREMHFRDSGHGETTGFYDWLRDRAHKIIGVRYWPAPEIESIVKTLPRLSYVVVSNDESCVDIFFSKSRGIEEGNSDDQAFGGNRVFGSANGKIAMSFETYFLNAMEIESIRAADAQWVELTG